MTVTEEVVFLARIVIMRGVHGRGRAVEETHFVASRGGLLHEIRAAVRVAREGFLEVVALGHREVENDVEVGRHFVEPILLEIDAHGLHTLGVPGFALGRIAESRRAEHRVALRGERCRERTGHPARHTGDEDLLTLDRFHHYLTTARRCTCRFRTPCS